jgi:SPP1 family predicted phage head-tail adaptor
MALGAGELDRRVTVELAVKGRDASNGEIVNWEPAFKRWAKKTDNSGQEVNTDAQTVRYADTIWILRYDSESLAIAPDTHRITHHGVIYRIVGIGENPGRLDGIRILTSSRTESEAAYGPTAG